MKHLLSTWMTAVVIISIFASRAEIAGQTPIPEIERKAFLNGMQLLFFPAEGGRTPFVLAISNGAAFDPVDKWGATYLLAKMIIRNLDTKNYLGEFNSRGIEIESRVDWDAIYFIGSSPAAEVEFTLLTLGELLVRPDLSDADFEAARDQVLKEVDEDSQRVELRTEQAFASALFRENPYGHPVKGTPETIRNLELRDVKVQARRLLLPNQSRLALYYSGDREMLFRRLSRRWGAWVQSDAAPFTFRQSERGTNPLLIAIDTDTERSFLRWGVLGISRNSKDFLAFKVLEYYLTLSLPDWAGEVEGINQIRGTATLAARRMPGFLQVSIETTPTHEAAYIAKLVSTISALKQGEMSQRRFDEAKKLALQEFQNALKDPMGCLLEVLAADIYGLGINFLPTYGLRLDRLTPEVFKKSLQDSLADGGYVAVVASPTSDLSTRLTEFGKVQSLN